MEVDSGKVQRSFSFPLQKQSCQIELHIIMDVWEREHSKKTKTTEEEREKKYKQKRYFPIKNKKRTRRE